MLTPEELAGWANDNAAQFAPFKIPEEKLMAMLELIRENFYYIIAPDIEDACRRKAGLKS